MTRLAEFLIRARWWVLAGFLALVVAAGLKLPHLRFDLSIGPLLEARPEQREHVQKFQDQLPAVGFHLYAVLVWDGPVARAQLETLQRLEERLASDLAHPALSLASVTVIDRDGVLPVPRLFRERVGDRTALEVVADHPLLQRRLLSADGHSACLGLVFHSADEDYAEIQRSIRATVQQIDPTVQDLRFVGGPLVQQSMTGHMTRDMVRSVLLEVLAFALLLPLLFRSARGSLLPILVVLCAIVLNFGLMIALGWNVSVIGVAVPGLILILGLCDSVHMMHRFEEALRDGRSWHDAIVEMMQRVGLACFFTSFTTGLGFLSLLVADHGAVRQFGLRAAVAVLVAFLTVLVLLPACLAIWPGRRTTVRVPWRLVPASYGRPRLTMILAGLVVVASVIGLGRAVVDSHWMEELPSDDPVVADLKWFQERFGGVLRLDVRLEGDLASPEVFAFLETLQTEFLRHDGVSTAESYTHWVRELVGPEAELTPLGLMGALTTLRLAGDRSPRHVLSEDHQLGRLEFRLKDVGSRRLSQLVDELNAGLAGLPDGVTGRVDGYLHMAQESSRLVVTTLLKSFLLSLVSITLFITWMFRSWRLGLVSVIPNMLPILVALGVNGWTGIPVRIGIVMIYCLGLGLAVDDTIHFLARYREERRRRPDGSNRDALRAAFQSTGKVLVETSMLLIAGALCYLPSSFRSMFDVGILLTTIVVAALLADLFLLPLLLEWTERRRPGPDSRAAETDASAP